MPRRRSVWSSWNYVGRSDAATAVSVTYWLNRLQGLPDCLAALRVAQRPAARRGSR